MVRACELQCPKARCSSLFCIYVRGWKTGSMPKLFVVGVESCLVSRCCANKNPGTLVFERSCSKVPFLTAVFVLRWHLIVLGCVLSLVQSKRLNTHRCISESKARGQPPHFLLSVASILVRAMALSLLHHFALSRDNSRNSNRMYATALLCRHPVLRSIKILSGHMTTSLFTGQ